MAPLSAAEYPPGRLVRLQSLLDLNPGKVFAEPDGWYGNIPFFDSRKYPDGYFDKDGKRNQDGTRAEIIIDPYGTFGLPDPNKTLTATPGGPPETRLTPDATSLPATLVYLDPKAVVAAWGFANPDTGAQSQYDVHRDGTITPYGSAPDMPPDWALAMSPYARSQFQPRPYDSAPATTDGGSSGSGSGGSTSNPSSTSSSGSGSSTTTGAVLSAAGTPLTGNAADLFLVNGVYYNGLGAVVTPVTNQSNVASANAIPKPLLLLGAAAALFFLTRKRRA